ncbi:MAG: DUF3617 domain-containing protein [Alphaproteobacteria bacterium]|nr:DUF3617 domain-containing protein [Alphaproteobacteria bacterium]MDE2629402.1 DUF3617 domain-containing protein [Alphaproteobacteria bacterium]
MSNKLAIVAAGMAAFAIVASHAAGIVPLNVRPGLWRVTTVPHMSGALPMDQSTLDRLTPQQRAKFAAAMKTGMANAVRPRTFKECLTREKLSKGFQLDKQETDCKRTIVASSASMLEVHEECSTAKQTRTGDFKFQTSGGEAATGTVDMHISQGGKTMNIDSTMQAQWLGADCGKVKDIEFER